MAVWTDPVEQRMATVKQTKVRFDSGGVACVGYVYHSAGGGGPVPCVVVGTGFSGTQDTPSIRAVAQAFAEAGFAALTFDYRHFGESEGVPRQLVRIKGQQEDFHAAIRCARSHAGIDPERVALWGTSLGGGHVIAVAADDPRVAAVVAQVPFNGFPRRVEGRSALATLRLLGAMVTDTVLGWLGLAPAYIRVVGPPGDLAVIASREAQQAIDGMQSSHWRNEVAPRALFEMMRYKPSARARRLEMPVLVYIAEHDRLSPVELPRQIADNAPRGELKSYPCAHFDFYRPDVRAQVVGDQVVFLRKHLVVDQQ
jgi:pimeloyl-ACP methyl ester carboxylesterase